MKLKPPTVYGYVVAMLNLHASILKQVMKKAKAKGIIPNSLSGDIGGPYQAMIYLLPLGVSAQCMARFM